MRKHHKLVCFLGVIQLIAMAQAASAADISFTKRYTATARGGMTIFGNSLGYICKYPQAKPISGTSDSPNCSPSGMALNTEGQNYYWQYDPATHRVNGVRTATSASSVAELRLPEGATEVLRAELYWSAAYEDTCGSEGANPTPRRASLARLESSGGARTVVAPTTYTDSRPLTGRLPSDPDCLFQAHADVTELLRTYKGGTYLLSLDNLAHLDNIPDSHHRYAAWGIIVFYGGPKFPQQYLYLGDVHERQVLAAPMLNEKLLADILGITPLTDKGTPDGQIAFISFRKSTGDSGKTGIIQVLDQAGNGVGSPAIMQDLTNSLFNSSRYVTRVGSTGSDSTVLAYYSLAGNSANDRPLLQGDSGSMSGVDLDQLPLYPSTWPTAACGLRFSYSSPSEPPLASAMAVAVPVQTPVITQQAVIAAKASSTQGNVCRPLKFSVRLDFNGYDPSVVDTVTLSLPPSLRRASTPARLSSPDMEPRVLAEPQEASDPQRPGQTFAYSQPVASLQASQGSAALEFELLKVAPGPADAQPSELLPQAQITYHDRCGRSQTISAQWSAMPSLSAMEDQPLCRVVVARGGCAYSPSERQPVLGLLFLSGATLVGLVLGVRRRRRQPRGSLA